MFPDPQTRVDYALVTEDEDLAENGHSSTEANFTVYPTYPFRQSSSSHKLRYWFSILIVVQVGLLCVYFYRFTSKQDFSNSTLPFSPTDQLFDVTNNRAPKRFDWNVSDSNPSLHTLTSYLTSLSPSHAKLYQDLLISTVNESSFNPTCGSFGLRQSLVQATATSSPIIVNYISLRRAAQLKNLNGVALTDPGGLADRTKGLVTAFAIAVALDVPFHIYWDPKETVSDLSQLLYQFVLRFNNRAQSKMLLNHLT